MNRQVLRWVCHFAMTIVVVSIHGVVDRARGWF